MTDKMGADQKIPTDASKSWLRRSFHPFQKALIRGLAVMTPPLLTIVLFIWAWNTVESYILKPIESLAVSSIVLGIDKTKSDVVVQRLVKQGYAKVTLGEYGNPPVATLAEGGAYVAIKRNWIPFEVYDLVENSPGHTIMLNSSDYYRQYARLRFLQRQYVLPAFIALFIVILYLVGKIFAVGVGRLIWNGMESMINRVPIIRNVYSSVKQVSDFAFNEQEIKVTRVVAVEYPRQGVWSMGFVTGEGMMSIRNAAQEPVVNVLMPTSPMPATGFTIAVPKSQTIDLDITMDQAIQFCVSCGVVVPPQQIAKKNNAAITETPQAGNGNETSS